MAVDLDALAAELRAAGFSVDVEVVPYINERRLDCSGVTVSPAGRCWFENAVVIDWSPIDIIRRHVSPEPSRRAAVDTEAVMELVTEYAASWGRNELARLTRVNGDKHQIRMYELRDAIRAMLEPHDAARMRETIAEVLWNQWVRYCDEVGDTDPSHVLEWAEVPDDYKELWFEMSDAVIRAIGGGR